MTKKFLPVVITAIAAIAMHGAKAQTVATDSGYNLNPCDKTTFIHRNNAETGTEKDHLNHIDIRAIKNFHKEFPEIKNERWYKSSDGGYIADFNAHSVKTVVAFNGKGQLHHTINYYDEKGLPRDLWNELKRTYYAYDILRIEEINFEDYKIYLVHVEDETYHKIIGVTEDNMLEVESFRKG
jgi:hypothetical protein